MSDDTRQDVDTEQVGDTRRTEDGDRRDIDRDPSSEQTRSSDGSERHDDGLLDPDDRESYQRRWDDIQVRFVDEPQQAVREADELVSEVTSDIAKRFSSARDDLERRWEDGEDPSTEELRRAVQRYRDFFQRLVAQ